MVDDSRGCTIADRFEKWFEWFQYCSPHWSIIPPWSIATWKRWRIRRTKGSGFFPSLAFSATPLIAASTTYGAFVPEMDVSISGDDVHVCNWKTLSSFEKVCRELFVSVIPLIARFTMDNILETRMRMKKRQWTLETIFEGEKRAGGNKLETGTTTGTN